MSRRMTRKEYRVAVREADSFAYRNALIRELRDQRDQLLAVAKRYEAWEADLVLNGDWSGSTPHLTQEQFDELLSIQADRNIAVDVAEHRP